MHRQRLVKTADKLPPARGRVDTGSVPPVAFTFSTAGGLRTIRRREFRSPARPEQRPADRGYDNHRMPAIAQLMQDRHHLFPEWLSSAPVGSSARIT